jgi:hypothetical protein
MWGLEKIADAFDKMHADVQRDLDRSLLIGGGQWAGETFDQNSALGTVGTWGTAIAAGLAYSISTFTLSSGKALVDVLRLGEGVKSGTLTGVGQDSLRVLNIVPALGMVGKLGTAGRAASIANAGRVTGTFNAVSQEYSFACGPTAVAAASRLSGLQKTMTLEEVAVQVGKSNVKSPTFDGMWFDEVKTVLNGVSSSTKELNMGGSGIEAVEAVAAQGKGPVVFGVQWWSGFQPARNVRFATTDPDHYLVAFRNMRNQVMVADQVGIRPISQLGNLPNGVGQFTLSSRALLVGDGVLMQTAKLGNTVNAATLGSAANRSFLTVGLGVQMVVVDQKTTVSIDSKIRETLGRPPRSWTDEQNADNSGNGKIPTPAVIPAPAALSPTLQMDSMSVLGKLPQNGESRELSQLMMETGLSTHRLREALLQLLRSGMIEASSWVSYENKPTPGMVKRIFRR